MSFNPNIFNYATKELSQDAFLCWLLMWGNKEAKEADLDLKHLADKFIYTLTKELDFNDEIKSVEVYKQWKNIDIWATINSNIHIIIEDKTGSGTHSNQLERYRNIALNWSKNQENSQQMAFIYLQTGNECSDINYLTSNHYNLIDRKMLLDIMNECNSSNDIFLSFREYMSKLESETNSYKILPIEKWSWHAWQGFYNEILQSLKQLLDDDTYILNWNYVPNPSGGFLNFVLWRKRLALPLYIQLEHGKLCYKIGEVTGNHYELRSKYHQLVLQIAQKKGYTSIAKPARFGSGTYMTLACVQPKDYIEQPFNLEKTIKNILDYNSLIDDILLLSD